MNSEEYEQVDRRIAKLETLVGDNIFVRRDYLDLMLRPIEAALVQIQLDAKAAKEEASITRREQVAERRGLRNIVIGALASGIVAIVVSIVISAVTR